MSKYKIIERYNMNHETFYEVEKGCGNLWFRMGGFRTIEEAKCWITSNKRANEREGTIVHEE